MVYTTTHPALAVLELLVHTDPAILPDDLMLSCWVLPIVRVEEIIDLTGLPADWAGRAECPSCRQLGAEWLQRGELALDVPSAVLPEGRNVLLNPSHADMRRVTLLSERPFRFDQRLL